MLDQSKALCEQLPYWDFNNNVCLLNDGSLVRGIEVTPIDIECFDNDRINQLTLTLRAMLNAVPENLTMQFHVETTSDFNHTLRNHRELLTTENQFLKSLDEKRCGEIEDDIKSQKLLKSKVYVYLRTTESVKHNAFSLKSPKKFSSEFTKNYEERSLELQDSLDAIAQTLISAGFKARDISEYQMINVLYKYFNPRRSTEIAAPDVYSVQDDFSEMSPRSQLVFSDLILDQSDFVLDEKRTRVISLKTLPEVTIAGMMDSFLRFSFHFDVLYSIQIPEQNKEMAKLQQKRRMAHSLSQTKGGQMADIENDAKLSTTEELIREIIDTGQRIFVTELLVVIKDDLSLEGLKRLNAKTREVLTRFKILSGAEGMQETVGAWPIFKNNMPLAPLKLERGKRMKTNNVADFLPLYGSRQGDENAVCLVHNRQGSLVSINPYDPCMSNYNNLTTGSSGSGKSFFNNFLLLQQMARGVKVFVIDIGGSYKKLTELMHGQYFEVKLSDEYAINPFHINDLEVGATSEKIKALTSIIEQMVTDEQQKLGRFERVLIEQTINDLYNEAKTSNKIPTLSDFEKLCKKSPEVELQKIGKLLFSWVGNSPYGKLLDRQSAFKTESPIITFDLKGLSQYPDLQSVMILILTNFILDQVESDRKTAKRVLLDEAWELLQSQAASQFMEYAARTFRKTGSGITFITQGVEEIIKSPIGSAILNNTAMKVIMSQKGDTKPLETSLKLNARELSLIQSLEQKKGFFSEAFLIEGEFRQVIRIYPSPVEYWISTSDAKDNKYLQSLMENNLSLEDAIHKAANEYPFGVSFGGKVSHEKAA